MTKQPPLREKIKIVSAEYNFWLCVGLGLVIGAQYTSTLTINLSLTIPGICALIISIVLFKQNRSKEN